MLKYVIAVFGMFFVLMGGVDWAVGALFPHGRAIIIIGAVAVAVAVFMHGWQKLQKSQWPLLMALTAAVFGTADTCVAGIHDVLIRPEVTPIAQWNPDVVSGAMTWVIALLIGVAIALVYHFGWNWLFRNRDSSWRSW